MEDWAAGGRCEGAGGDGVEAGGTDGAEAEEAGEVV